MEYILEMTNINKSFSGVQVLNDINFKLKKGEIHALLGANGAGKSTLIKILSGAHLKDSGTIKINGEVVNITNPVEAKNLGVQCIYQELSLIPDLTIAQNIFIGKEELNGIFLNHEIMNKKAKELMNDLEIDVDVKTKVRDLGIGHQFFTEICRCLIGNASIVIMDEPTSAMSPIEYKQFLKTIRLLRNRDISIIYISHHLDEIFDFCDSITILRNGFNQLSTTVASVNKRTVIEEMVGEDVSDYLEREYLGEFGNVEPILKVENVSTEKLKDVSFMVKTGEIFGVTGLLGAGKTELGNVIFGVDKFDKGNITFDGNEFSHDSIQDRIDMGIGLVPEDRKTSGLFQEFSIKDNVSLLNLNLFKTLNLFINRKKEAEFSDRFAKDLNVKFNNLNDKVRFLSGGNQQKVVLAKWISKNLKLLILDEPTRGIDVGSKEEIYSLIRKLAREGLTIIVMSSEVPEIIALSERILVLHNGQSKGILNGDDATESDILTLTTEGDN
ncbi:MAG: sugar ABC transporter ATP-binding protein [Saccharofermentanales bacterium]